MKGHKAHHEHHGRHPGEKVNPRHIHHKAHELVHARKRGGKLEHEKKHVGKVEGEEHHCHGGRAPRKARKSGGGCESSPFSSALHGTAATGRKLERETMD